MRVGGYTLTYRGLSDTVDSNGIETVRSDFTLSQGGHAIDELHPGQRIYPGFSTQPASSISITQHGVNDLYVFLAAFDSSTATIRAFINPLVSAVWLGGLIVLAGGILCWWPERRRVPARLAERRLERVEVPV